MLEQVSKLEIGRNMKEWVFEFVQWSSVSVAESAYKRTIDLQKFTDKMNVHESEKSQLAVELHQFSNTSQFSL